MIERIRNTPIQNNTKEQGTSKIPPTYKTDDYSEETPSNNSNDSMEVPAINIKKYLGVTGVRYIQMGQASHDRENQEWNLEETIRQAEQKFSTDLKMIATEATIDDKLQKPLVCLERRTTTQIQDEYKHYPKSLSASFGVMFYDDKIIVPENLRNTVITLLHKGHHSFNKMKHSAKPFWWPKRNKEFQQKCDECIPWKKTGRNIEPQIPMTEVNYLPTTGKPNQEIQLCSNGPIRFKQRRFFLLVSIDRYSRWPAACICKTPTGRTATNFLEHYINLNGYLKPLEQIKSQPLQEKNLETFLKT